MGLLVGRAGWGLPVSVAGGAARKTTVWLNTIVQFYLAIERPVIYLPSTLQPYLMNGAPEPDFVHAEQFILRTLQQEEALISVENAGFVRHYIKYAEYEMAFEVLFLSLMEHPRQTMAKVDFTLAVEMAKEFRIDSEGGIFDYNFFDKLSRYAAEA